MVFVIDGAHRISALIAWVLDDYGDGTISKMFFDSIIPGAQNDNAEKTRRYIKKKILEIIGILSLPLNILKKVTQSVS